MPYWASRTILRLGLPLALICCSLPTFTQTLQPYGRCSPPAQQGVNICMPYNGAMVPSPFQLIGAGTSGRGLVVQMQLWADGKKIIQTFGMPFDQPINLPLGNHQLTLIEVDDTGFSSKSAPLNITVVSGDSTPCSPPSTPGVNICMPNAPCNTSPWLNISAAGKGQTGPVVRMEVWITNGSGNAAKIANFPGNSFVTHPIFFDAFYTLEIWEIDSNGHALKADVHQDGPC
jgi:hypothetical protein